MSKVSTKRPATLEKPSLHFTRFYIGRWKAYIITEEEGLSLWWVYPLVHNLSDPPPPRVPPDPPQTVPKARQKIEPIRPQEAAAQSCILALDNLHHPPKKFPDPWTSLD